MRIVVHFVVIAVSIAAAAWVVPGIHAGGWGAILAISLVFALVNVLVKPILKLLTCPLQVLTLGLFTLVLNALLLMLTAWLGKSLGIDFTVDGFWAAFFGALLVAIVSTILLFVLGGVGKKAEA